MENNVTGNWKLYWGVWSILLALTLIMVYLDQTNLARPLLVTILIAAMMVKAGLIAGYFMHLRFERLGLILLVLVGLLATGVVLFALIAPDGTRILRLSAPAW